MIVLGIETSCDETAVGIVENARKVLSSIVSSQIKEHSLYGGVVPEIASRRHMEKITSVIQKSLETAKLDLNQIDAIAATYSPGLVGSLLVGLNFAKGLSFSLKKPLIGINHLKAHIAANYLTNKDLKPPFLALIISGGHTNIVEVKDYCDFKLISRSVDDSVGEAFDKVGRALGFSYPAGAKIDEISKLGDKQKYKFPVPSVKNFEFNFSFSGLKTAVLNTIQKEKTSPNYKVEDIAASFQNVICEIVCDKIFKAAIFYKYSKIVVCGGVCANSSIRKKLKKESENLNISLFMPELKFCTDNGAMVAAQGYFEFKNDNIEKNYGLNAFSISNF